MCIYPSDKPGEACGKLDSNQLTNDEQQEILQAHNDFRAKVASGQETRGLGGGQPAGDIPPLAWDDGLAEVAQRWATQCIVKHDDCSNTAGQNIASKSASNGYFVTMTDLVTMWFNEVKNMDPQNVKHHVDSDDTGHYTQLVWGTTTHIGCGVAKYKEGMWYNTYLVCNYGPGGNLPGAPVYQTV
ncbi:venom allergen 5-like [Aphidius gifuensis]|uniref:venom allergen 5-like n=1 Tax=Aphidius gifuensis TaxID=684658 RepID=UPI001CDCEFD4|nr:venom allergen 5-like [Aphidius gifuensis]